MPRIVHQSIAGNNQLWSYSKICPGQLLQIFIGHAVASANFTVTYLIKCTDTNLFSLIIEISSLSFPSHHTFLLCLWSLSTTPASAQASSLTQPSDPYYCIAVEMHLKCCAPTWKIHTSVTNVLWGPASISLHELLIFQVVVMLLNDPIYIFCQNCYESLNCQLTLTN